MRALFRGLVLLLPLLAARPASAGSFLGRSLALSTGRMELGLGAGLGHVPDELGLGFNFELGYGLSSSLELRLRSGLRAGHDGRVTRADVYGRPFETETYNTGGDTLANPEIGLLWELIQGHTGQIGFDTRVVLPVSGDISLMVALPVRLRLPRARIDTGLYVPIFFHDGPEDDTTEIISIPFHLFFQPSSDLYLGPITGVRFHEHGGTDVPLGLALGTSISWDADLRFWLLFPDVSHSGSAKVFGVGVGLYVLF
jgi:hypothetical protein